MHYSLRNIKRCHFEITLETLNARGTLMASPKDIDNVENLDLGALSLFSFKNRRELFLLCPQEKNPQIQINTH